MVKVNIRKDASGRIVVSFPYDPIIVSKVKAIEGRRWHPDEKHWSLPNTDGVLEKILKVFEEKEIQIDPVLQVKPSISVIARRPDREEGTPKQSHFEDLRRELVSRKYSYKTIKGYLYYNFFRGRGILAYRPESVYPKYFVYTTNSWGISEPCFGCDEVI